MSEQLNNLLSAYGELQKVNAHLTRQLAEKDAEIKELRDGLKRLEWTPCDDYCENDAHDLAGPNSADYDDMHHRSCMGCGAMQCEGHRPDCWLNKLIGGEK